MAFSDSLKKVPITLIMDLVMDKEWEKSEIPASLGDAAVLLCVDSNRYDGLHLCSECKKAQRAS